MQHFAFARAEALQWAPCDGCVRTVTTEKSSYGRAEILFAGCHRPHGADQLRTGGILHNVPECTGTQRAVNVLGCAACGQHQDLGLRKSSENTARCVNPSLRLVNQTHDDYI